MAAKRTATNSGGQGKKSKREGVGYWYKKIW